MIERKRLQLYAATKEQMEAFIAAQPVDILKAAHTEMLNGALAQNKIGGVIAETDKDNIASPKVLQKIWLFARVLCAISQYHHKVKPPTFSKTSKMPASFLDRSMVKYHQDIYISKKV